MDINFCKNRLHEELTKSDIQQEIKKSMGSNDLKDLINKMIKQEIKNNKELENKVVDIAGNVLTQLYKTLWTKRGFWKSSLSNKTS